MSWSDWVFGRRLADSEEEQQRVGVMAGIPMLGLDALSSAAYGPEASLTLLIPLGIGGVRTNTLVTALIIALLFILYISYRQTLVAYPKSGGSYTVARENLGTYAGLLAAAALLLDYVLVVAVGISSGVGALVSAFPGLQAYTLSLCLAILALVTFVNLRGVRASGIAFLVPTYLFVASLLAVLAIGAIKVITSGGRPIPVVAPPVLTSVTSTAGLWMFVRAFATGCTAMTGVEAVSNGMGAFREPSLLNARRTLTSITVILGVMLAGIAVLCQCYEIGATEPGQPGYESILSQLVGAIVGKGFFYYVTLASILSILSFSANTGFADFPRLCRFIAEDGYLPSGFTRRGHRLVHSNGIIVLAILSAVLLVYFRGITDGLIPLFAIGAFMAFTLSQAGMAVYWWRNSGPGSLASILINGTGSVCTTTILFVVVVSRFTDGGWIAILLIPAMLAVFLGTRAHRGDLAGEIPLNSVWHSAVIETESAKPEPNTSETKKK